VFLLVAMIFLIPLIEKIPNTALAAVLIYAGWRLTSPKHYIQIYQIGPEQLAIFLLTVVVTLVEDLLLGIAAGIVLKFVLHWIRGVQWSQFFKADGRFESAEGVFYIKGPAIFSNLLSFKKQINKHQNVAPLVLDFGDCSFVDHTFLEFIYRLKRERNQVSKPLHIQNLEQMQAVSGYKTSARRRLKNINS
jgi:MFS superfamily sulfate permease-like transporter